MRVSHLAAKGSGSLVQRSIQLQLQIQSKWKSLVWHRLLKLWNKVRTNSILYVYEIVSTKRWNDLKPLSWLYRLEWSMFSCSLEFFSAKNLNSHFSVTFQMISFSSHLFLYRLLVTINQYYVNWKLKLPTNLYKQDVLFELGPFCNLCVPKVCDVFRSNAFDKTNLSSAFSFSLLVLKFFPQNKICNVNHEHRKLGESLLYHKLHFWVSLWNCNCKTITSILVEEWFPKAENVEVRDPFSMAFSNLKVFDVS